MTDLSDIDLEATLNPSYETMSREELIECCKSHDAHHEEHHERERVLTKALQAAEYISGRGIEEISAAYAPDELQAAGLAELRLIKETTTKALGE